jgi:lysophospholipase L1-like esterase
MRSIAIVATFVWLTSCNGEQVNDSANRSERTETQSNSPSDASWARLSEARIYFGHQSVGGNIVEGLRDLGAGRNGSQLRIVRSRERSSSTPTLVEFTIGENGRPESKMKDFAAALHQIDDTAAAIAIFKYCYLDITPETNVEQLFASHRKALQEMRTQHPNLTFVHATAPLTRLESGPRFIAKRILGKPTTRDANAKRNRFNAMLREEYAGEPMFDLATVESTRPDGSRSFFNEGAAVVYTLAPELTDDGGHLNAAGRRAAAEEFAVVIGRVAAGQQQLVTQPASP